MPKNLPHVSNNFSSSRNYTNSIKNSSSTMNHMSTKMDNSSFRSRCNIGEEWKHSMSKFYYKDWKFKANMPSI